MAAMLILTLILLAVTSQAKAVTTPKNCNDTFTSRGTEFVFAFAHNVYGREPPRILVTTDHLSASLHVTMPRYKPGMRWTLEVPAWSSMELDLPLEGRLQKSGKSNKAFLLDSDVPVGVVGFNRVQSSSDAFLALPVRSLGTEYYAVTWNQDAFVLIVGAYDNTTCDVTFPSCKDFSFTYNGVTYKGGQTLTERLGRLETLQLLSARVLDMTGTHVRCSRPVALYSGSKVASEGGLLRKSSQDHLVEQLLPVQRWGRDHVVVHSRAAVAGLVRVVASQDRTSVSLGLSDVTAMLDKAGDYVEWDQGRSKDMYVVRADKPVQVVLLDTRLVGSLLWYRRDSSMTLLLPSDLAMSAVSLATPPNVEGASAHVVVLHDKRNNDTLLINTAKVAPKSLHPVKGSDWLEALTFDLDSAQRHYRLEETTHNSSILAYVFATANDESYAFPASFGQACETPAEKDIDDCSPNPCQNNGTCIDRLNGFKCTCKKGFSGDLCDKKEGGCFHKWGRVRVEGGREVLMEEVRVGDRVLATDHLHRPVFSPVLYFLYRHPSLETTFVHLWTEGKDTPLVLTPSHALFVYDVTSDQWRSVLAADVTVGMKVGVLSSANSTLTARPVTSVSLRQMTSAISPLTEHGTIVVDDVMASCYGKHADHQQSHTALTWARGLHWLGAGLGLTNRDTGLDMEGRHWSVDVTLKLVCLLSKQPWC